MQDPHHSFVSLILAAGKGTRMQSSGTLPGVHKVCLPLDGIPVIERAIRTYERCGAEAHAIVVGAQAEQVIQAATAAPGQQMFCFQAEQRGTGHATRVAADMLRAVGYTGNILVVAGDKVIDDHALHHLVARFHEREADLAFLVGRTADFPTAGRIVEGPDDTALAITEVADIRRAALLCDLRRETSGGLLEVETVRRKALEAFSSEKKARQALGPLWEAVEDGLPLTAEGLAGMFPPEAFTAPAGSRRLPPEDFEPLRYANLSVYLFRAPVLYEALDALSSDNAQQEEYLTDTVAILAERKRSVVIVPLGAPDEVMAYNTPEEFQAIEHRLASRRAASHAKPRTVEDWLEALDRGEAERFLSRVYGNGNPTEERGHVLRSALEAYRSRFDGGPVTIARAPGRLNVMGRHIDHQGGTGNYMAIDRDMFLVIGSRDDGEVHLRSPEPSRFPDRRFTLETLVPGRAGEDWRRFVDTPAVRARCAEARGEWTLYIEAAAARFQAATERTLRGMNIAAASDIPIAAGLSSSSALVVAAAEGIAALNGLGLPPERFVELCGEAEWYVGTRGGAGDHAAMKLARAGHVVPVDFLPFRTGEPVSLPPDVVFAVCNSHHLARKTAGARDAFNHRVACYHIGREWLKARHPELADRIEHLRDVTEERLYLDLSGLVRLLSEIPETLSRAEIMAGLPEETACPLLEGLPAAGPDFPVRGVVLFGLAECARSYRCADLLRTGDLAAFGRWMTVSHDGDRVSRWDERGNCTPFSADCSDAAMEVWQKTAVSGDESAYLPLQPGAYSCSTPLLDRLVDTALSVPGVFGAQLSGAGMGGCIMALVHRDALDALRTALEARVYAPMGLPPEVFPCRPVAGSGVL